MITIGDRFPVGRFGEIHSRFDRVVNMNYGNQVVSVITHNMEASPFAVRIEGINLLDVDSVGREGNLLIINDQTEYHYGAEQIYNSSLQIDAAGVKSFKLCRSVVKQLIISEAPASSLGFLLKNDGCYYGKSRFDRELARQMLEAYEAIKDGDWDQGVAGFRGKGIGFTPMGDDFLTGLLIGLGIRQAVENKELSGIREFIYSHALGSNLPVNTFLTMAYQGWYSENWKQMLTEMFSFNQLVVPAVRKILEQGETSGADALTGFLAAWETKLR